MGRPGKKKIMKIQLDSHYHLLFFLKKPSKVTIWHTFLECYTQKFFYKNANKLCRQQTIFLQERISSQVASSDESSLGNIIVNFYNVQQGFLHFLSNFCHTI